MKKKMSVFLLASIIAVESFNVARAAEFSTATDQNIVLFSDDEDIAEIETELEIDSVNQFSMAAVGEEESNSKSEDKLKVTGQGMKWLDHNSVELKFQSNVKGIYYIETVEHDANAPEIDITRAGTPIEANATITENVADLPEYNVDIYVCIVSESDKRNYGAVMFSPVSNDRPITPTPSHIPVIANVTDSIVQGFEDALVFYPNAFYDFSVIGAGTQNSNPGEGDVRWVPAGWSMSMSQDSSTWNTSWKIGAREGIYTEFERTYSIYIFFQKEKYTGNEWTQEEDVESVAYQFRAAPLSMPTPTPTPQPPIIIVPPEITKYTVTFKDRGKVVKTEKVKSGDTAEYPFINRNGYELSWDKDFSKITADTTVNAVWTVIKPAKVTSLTVEADKKFIVLSWDETEYTSYYLVYRKADAETEYTQVAKTTKVLWTDSKAVPGTQYSYKVVAIRSLDGNKYQGADSDIVTANIGTPQIGDVYSVGALNYKIINAKEVRVTGLAKATDTLVIPSSVTISGKVYKVTSIQEKTFYRNEDLVNVKIGNNIIEVGEYAFYQCSGLETVKFGKRVAIINTCAFTQCPNLENVTLPSSIKRIGAKVFYQCTSIKTLKINGVNLEYVGKKGLAVNKAVTLKLPKKSYAKYQKLIKASSIYAKTKFSKF